MSTPIVNEPEHMRIGVTMNGDGPVAETSLAFHHYACWCGRAECTLYEPGEATDDVLVARIAAAWRRDTNWEEFGRDVGAILAAAGLSPGRPVRGLLPGAEALLTAPPIDGPGDGTSLGR